MERKAHVSYSFLDSGTHRMSDRLNQSSKSESEKTAERNFTYKPSKQKTLGISSGQKERECLLQVSAEAGGGLTASDFLSYLFFSSSLTPALHLILPQLTSSRHMVLLKNLTACAAHSGQQFWFVRKLEHLEMIKFSKLNHVSDVMCCSLSLILALHLRRTGTRVCSYPKANMQIYAAISNKS